MCATRPKRRTLPRRLHKAYRALPQFRGDSAFYTWLYRIAINTAKNAVVSRDRSPIEYDLDRSNPE